MDTLIWDLGGVLIDWNPEYVYRRIFDDEAQMRWFFENICTHDWNVEQDAGRPLAEATEELVAKHPEWEAEIRAFYGRWEEMLGGPIPESVALLDRLRKQGRHRLLALTNWSAETFPVARERYEFLQWFEGIVVSGEEKTRKPFPRMYRILLERYGVEPRRALFIDDSLPNVEGARAVGLQAVQFRSSEELEELLLSWGVLEAKEV
ncbi:MAG: HAD family phosphatase [Bacteroidetes bacterium]|nr:MAG: HAD family phosphatase [Bacteroidota bacterium]